jgi:GTPase SAR1 family protein
MVDNLEGDYSIDNNGNSMSMVRHKLVFVGDIAVGKSSIIYRILENKYRDNYEVSLYIFTPFSHPSVLTFARRTFASKVKALSYKSGTPQDKSATRALFLTMSVDHR